MKTILVFGLKNVVGGIENYLMMMHKYLHDQLHFVFLVEKAETFIYKQAIYDNNGEIEYLPERHALRDYTNSFREVLQKYKSYTDILYVNVGHISFDIIPITIALDEGYKVITHSHSAMQEPIKQFKYRVRHDILRKIAMIRLKHLNVMRLAVSKRSGDYLYKGKPYNIVSPGIEVLKFKYDSQIDKKIRGQYELTDSVVLGFVGRLVAVKNPVFLVNILSSTKRVVPKAKLLIVGDGELKESVKLHAEHLGLQNDVVFVGEVENVQDYYQAMDVLLAPSLSEGMPLGIMEAQSAGVYCICAKGNFPETIDVTGIVSFCDLDKGSNEWAAKVNKVYQKKIDRGMMNDKVMCSPFNIQNASKKLLEAIELIRP